MAAMSQQRIATHTPSKSGEPGDLRDYTRVTETYLLTVNSFVVLDLLVLLNHCYP